MNLPNLLFHLMLADFLERVRRPGIWAVAVLGVGFGILFLPPADSQTLMLALGPWRGVYNSAWVGIVFGLLAALALLFETLPLLAGGVGNILFFFGWLFYLGGHSLLAVRLFARLNKQLEHNLPLAVLFTAPTIAGLAELIKARAGQKTWSSLVPIQPVGEKRPFFFVHGGAGQVLHFRELAEALGAERPFYGLQPQGWDQHRVAVPTVRQLAADYLAEIRTVQPAGPYYLGGYCFGGLVAFEMARQLQAAGETVATLAIVDPSPIKRIPQKITLGQVNQSGWQRHQRALSQRRPGEKLRYLANSGRHRFQTIMKNFRDRFGLDNMKRLVLRTYLLSGRPVPEAWRDYYLMELVSRPAGRSYVPDGRFQGKIDLFVATRAATTWPLAARDGADIERVAADHLSILKEPHIQVIAQKLRF